MHKRKLEELMAEMPFSKHAKAVERERCEADLLYEILMHPEHMLTLKDPATGAETQMMLIDRILGASLELVSKKNSPDFGKSRMISDATAFLQGPAADPTVKLFNFLFILSREQEIQALMLKGYDMDHPGNLWSTNADLHLSEFVKQIQDMVDRTLKWPCNERNIVDVVRNMVRGARLVYLTT